MAADTEYISLDLIEKKTWDDIVNGKNVVVDDELSTTSKNPVQNKVVKQALDGLTPYRAVGVIESGQEKTITLDKTASELYEATLSGRPLLMTGDSSGVVLESLGFINAVKLSTEGGAVTYQFYYMSDKYYTTGNLEDTDVVVFTET